MPRDIIGSVRAIGQKIGFLRTADERFEKTKDNTTHTVNFVTTWADFPKQCPLYYSEDPQFPGLVLTKASAVKHMGSLARVTLVYEAPPFPGGSAVIPPPEFSETGSTIEVDIRQHPSFNNETYFPKSEFDENSDKPPFKKGTSKYGVTAYLVGSGTCSYTEWFLSTPAPNLRGIIATPPNKTEVGHWLRVSSEINKNGQFWSRRDTYMFSAKAWDTDIYSPEALGGGA